MRLPGLPVVDRHDEVDIEGVALTTSACDNERDPLKLVGGSCRRNIWDDNGDV